MTSSNNPPPADQQLGRQQFPSVMCNQYLQQLNALWTISSHSATQIRKLLLRFQTKNDNLVETVEIPLKHLMESLPFVYQLRA